MKIIKASLLRVMSSVLYIALFLFLSSTILFKLNGFTFVNSFAEWIYYILFFLLTSLVTISLWYEKSIIIKNICFVLFVILFGILASIKLLLFIPTIGFLFVYCLDKRIKLKIFAIVPVVSVILISVFCYVTFSVFSFISNVDLGFPVIQTVSEKLSPDGKLKIIVESIDQGALGGDVVVSVVSTDSSPKVVEGKNIFGLIKKVRVEKPFSKGIQQFKWGVEPNISWKDNREIMVDGKVYDIYNDSVN